MQKSASGSLTRCLKIIGAVAALAMLPSGTASAAQSATAGVPAATSSFYVYGSFVDVCGLTATTECPLYDDAATEAVPSAGGMTILDFGAPCFEPATLAWGAQMFNSQGCTPDSTLAVLAQAWVRGYQVNPNRSNSPGYVVALGTSNSLTAAVPGNALSLDQMAQHGQAWFTSVVSPTITATKNLASRVTVWAGNDIEESADGNWYDGPTTAAWVDAYAGASGASKPCVWGRNGLMVDYGDYVPNEPGWSPGAVYHVAWQAAPACPMPEIYLPENAHEWQSLNQFAVTAGLPPLQFTGVLSEDGGDGSMAGLDSWSSLRNVSGQSPAYMSVIGVTGPVTPEVPDPPTAVTATPGPGLMTVAWTAPAWDGGGAVTSYTVAVYSGWKVVETVPITGFPVPEVAIIAGLVNGASYTFYVSATNRVGTGPQSLPSRSAVPSALFPLR